jgi:catechol 2,3-dioxygenase-like lactoylglutathione lyase family enzyme
MRLTLAAVSLDALRPPVVARFWAGVLGTQVLEQVSDEVCVVPLEGTFDLTVRRSDLPKLGPNRIHFDVTTSSQRDMDETVALALELGGRHIDIGQTPDDGHVVLADPEGNELCVIEPGNSFLADTARIGAVNCDGTQALGYFWSAALDWPLVWDQDEETAIQSPEGGSKITWSGPPLMPRESRDRLRLDIAVTDGSELVVATQRLVDLGARWVPVRGQDPVDEVVMTDPDGNEFRLSTQT